MKYLAYFLAATLTTIGFAAFFIPELPHPLFWFAMAFPAMGVTASYLWKKLIRSS